MRKIREKYLLYIGVAAALLPTLLLRDFTIANELRYLSIADEALRNHTLFAFTNHGVPYSDKPPLYLWAGMLCRWITGGHYMWLLSLLSLVPAYGIVRVMDTWTSGEMNGGSRALARLMLFTCGLFTVAAVTLRMDMLMCFFIVLAMHEFWKMLSGESRRSRWLFPLYIFLAVFTKGPLGLLVPLCGTVAFLVLRQRASELLRCWGWRTWGVLAACCGLWFAAVYAEGGETYLHDLVFRQTAGRAVNSFHHAQPAYFYAAGIWTVLAPWSLLAAVAVTAALRPKFVRSDLQCFFLCVSASAFVLLSFISAKLEIYLLPAVPFVIYVCAMFLSRLRYGLWIRVAIAVPAAALSLALPLLVALTATLCDRLPYLDNGMLYAAAAVLTLEGARSLWLLYKKSTSVCYDLVIRHIGTGLLLALFVGGWAFPRLNAYIGYGELCRKALELSRERGITDFRAWRLSRAENMDVYLHRDVSVLPPDECPATGHGPFLLLTRKGCLEHFSGKETYVIGSYAIVVEGEIRMK